MSESRTKSADEKFCLECGQIIRRSAEICPKCGTRQFYPTTALGPVTANGKNRIVAALLALILGGFGVHKFYLGQVGLGVVYLIFFWSFIPAIIGFIEGIILLTTTDRDFAEKYGGGVG